MHRLNCNSSLHFEIMKMNYTLGVTRQCCLKMSWRNLKYHASLNHLGPCTRHWITRPHFVEQTWLQDVAGARPQPPDMRWSITWDWGVKILAKLYKNFFRTHSLSQQTCLGKKHFETPICCSSLMRFA